MPGIATRFASTVMRFSAALSILIAAAACSNEHAGASMPHSKPVNENPAKILVTREGIVFLDGAPVPIERLGERIRELGDAVNCFWYHRESPEAPDPHPNAMKAIEILAGFRLPIAFYADADFTTRVRPGS